MKKFFYLAVIALATVFASCAGEGTSDYYKNHKLNIDWDKCEVNGHKYDNEKEQCWKVESKSTVLGATVTTETYEWETEFVLVASWETAMAGVAGVGKSSYSYIATTDKDSDACLAHNDKD